MNPIVIAIFVVLIFVVMILWCFKFYKDGRKEMLNELWENGDITDDVYKEKILKEKI